MWQIFNVQLLPCVLYTDSFFSFRNTVKATRENIWSNSLKSWQLGPQLPLSLKAAFTEADPSPSKSPHRRPIVTASGGAIPGGTASANLGSWINKNYANKLPSWKHWVRVFFWMMLGKPIRLKWNILFYDARFQFRGFWCPSGECQLWEKGKWQALYPSAIESEKPLFLDKILHWKCAVDALKWKMFLLAKDVEFPAFFTSFRLRIFFQLLSLPLGFSN